MHSTIFKNQKVSSKHSPGVYITATPIGNLGDITLRALDILTSANLILAEDTRRIGKLLAHYQISPKQLCAFHDHSRLSPRLMERIRAEIQEGGIIALASDAGTPLISDPGFPLVRQLILEDLPIFSCPGPSSVIAALSIAGLPCHRWSFGGFLPRKHNARKDYLKSFNHPHGGALVFFETAPRLAQSLKDMAGVFGRQTQSVCIREMTKKFEEKKHGTLGALADFYQNHAIKGEIIIMLALPKDRLQS